MRGVVSTQGKTTAKLDELFFAYAIALEGLIKTFGARWTSPVEVSRSVIAPVPSSFSIEWVSVLNQHKWQYDAVDRLSE